MLDVVRLGIFQDRLLDGAPGRRAANSCYSKVTVGPKALLHGLSSPGGAGTVSTSNTELTGPSISTSSRTLNRCWWYGAARPGAIMLAKGPASSPSTPMVDMMPDSFTSSCREPSR